MRVDDESRQPGRALAGLAKRPGSACDTNRAVGVYPLCRVPAGRMTGGGPRKLREGQYFSAVCRQAGITHLSAGSIQIIYHGTELDKVVYYIITQTRICACAIAVFNQRLAAGPSK